MNVVFDARAVEDLQNIHLWISGERPTTADAVIERILASIERLSAFPEMGRTGIVSGTREWVVPRLPFIVVYAADERDLRVIGVFHVARQR
jgi:toxin ParE1/3/4